MSKKSFIIILVLSVVVTYLTPVIEILITGLSFSSIDRGLPLKFHISSFSGSGIYDSTTFGLDVIFWFIILFGIWKLIGKLQKR